MLQATLCVCVCVGSHYISSSSNTVTSQLYSWCSFRRWSSPADMMSFIPGTNILAACAPVTGTLGKCVCVCVCVYRENPDNFTSGCMASQPQELSPSSSHAHTDTHTVHLSAHHLSACLSFQAPLAKSIGYSCWKTGATVTERNVSNSVKTCWRVNRQLCTHTFAFGFLPLYGCTMPSNMVTESSGWSCRETSPTASTRSEKKSATSLQFSSST